jgi:hypothetical protein
LTFNPDGVVASGSVPGVTAWLQLNCRVGPVPELWTPTVADAELFVPYT